MLYSMFFCAHKFRESRLNRLGISLVSASVKCIFICSQFIEFKFELTEQINSLISKK